ncbi:MAG: excisionase family DNA-binding protein [Thermoguttaceae bacterium]|nr:excisionase family DNA-binding protein [Thermoguttaceae bacterium]
MTQTNDQLLTTREAAERMHVTLATIRQWIYAGKLVAYRVAGGHHRIPASALAEATTQSEQPRKPDDGQALQRAARIEQARNTLERLGI